MDWVLEGQVQVVTSPLIIEEYRAIVKRPKFHRFGFPPLWLEFLIEESMRLPDAVEWPHRGPDPKDLPFLAHDAGAWLVTGNPRHFPQELREGSRQPTIACLAGSESDQPTRPRFARLRRFSVIALALAAAGLYGGQAYLITRRTNEIGIRIALGAQRDQLLRLMLADGLRPALFGLALGLTASAGAARLIRSMLYETRALDPAVFGWVVVALLLVAMLACIVPACRASLVVMILRTCLRS
jgi:hypothetical protein